MKPSKMDQEKNFILKDDERNDVLLEKLSTMQKSHAFCDVVLRVQNKEFHAHKNVLAATSDVFLDHFMKDKDMDVLILDDINLESFEYLFRYIYTSSLNVPKEEVHDLFLVAKQLRVPGLVKACSDFLSNHISLNNVTNIRESVGINQNLELCNAADAFIRQNAQEIITSSELVKVKVSVDILVDTRPEMDMEDRLAELVIDWLEGAIDDADLSLDEFADQTALLYLTRGNSLVDCRNLDQNSLTNVSLIQDYIVASQASKKQALPTGSKRNDTVKGRPRNRTPDVNGPGPAPELVASELDSRPEAETCLLALSDLKMGSNVTCLAKIRGRLICLSIHVRPLTEVPVPNGDARSASPCDLERSMDSSVFGEDGDALGRSNRRQGGSSEGGSVSGDEIPTLPLGDGLRTNSLEPLANMLKPRCASGVVVHNDHIVVIGGYNRGECMTSAEKYCFESNTWTNMPNMSTPRSRFMAVELGGMIYACGGSRGTRDMETVERFDPEQNRWTAVASMQQERSNHGAAVLDGKIYVVGGCAGAVSLKTCEVYDPKSDTWTSIAPMQTARSQTAVCAHKGLLYVVGGFDAWNCLASGEVYDPAQNRWMPLPKLSHARRGAGLLHSNVGAGVTKYSRVAHTNATTRSRLSRKNETSDKIFILGGSDGTASICTVDVLDLTTMQWSAAPALNVARANLGAVCLGNYIFAVGGFNGKHFLNSMEQMDLQSASEWCMDLPAEKLKNRHSSQGSSSGLGETPLHINGFSENIV